MYISVVFSFFLCISPLRLQSQTAKPELFIVGEECPESLFKDVYSARRELSLADFQGKWLIVDFFSIGCSACFESLPALNDLRREYFERLEILMVGRYTKHLPLVYEKFRKHYNLDLPVVYDSAVFRRFAINYVPFIVIVDPEGIVRGITYAISKANIRDFLAGKNPVLPKVLDMAESTFYDPEKLLLVNGNGGADTSFIYRSVLAKWLNDIAAPQQNFIRTEYYGNRVQVVGVDLLHLYNIAYGDTVFRIPDERGSSYGRVWRAPILELNDSSEFVSERASGSNMYNYSLVVPPGKSSQFIKKVMQRDLINYFGYSVKVENRLMPCWKLTFDKRFRQTLTAKTNSVPKVYPARSGISIRNGQLKDLIWNLFIYFQDQPPFIDETGIEDNIDLDLKVILTDFNAVREALLKKGFKLERGYTQMKVIVIRDKVDQENSN